MKRFVKFALVGSSLSLISLGALAVAPATAQDNEPSDTPRWFVCISVNWQDEDIEGYIGEPVEAPENVNTFWLTARWKDAIAKHRAEQGQEPSKFSSRCGYGYLTEAAARAGFKSRLAWFPTRNREGVALPFPVTFDEKAFAPMPQITTMPATD